MLRTTLVQRLAGALAVGTVLAACGGDAPAPATPRATITPEPVAWQRPAGPVQVEGFARARLTGMMRQHQATVNSIAFAANGTRMATASADQTVIVWNLANGEPLFVRGETPARYVFFGPGDETLITVDRDGQAQIWSMDLSPPRELQAIESFGGHDEPAGLVAQSPDRSLLAFGTLSGRIRLWRVPDAAIAADLPGHSDVIQALVFSPDGALLASTSADRGVRVWTLPGGELLHDLSSDDPTLHVAFSPDGRTLAVARSNALELWDLASGEQLVALGTADYALAGALAFSPDGALLAGCGQSGVVGVWRAADGEFLGGLPLNAAGCAGLAFGTDGRLLATLPAGGRDILLWNVTRITEDVPPERKILDQRRRENLGLPSAARFYDLTWSPDGRFIALLDELGPIYLLSAAE